MNNLTEYNYKACLTLKKLESYRSATYKPVADDPWTLGYGTTRKFFDANTVCTEQEAKSWLKEDVDALGAALHAHVTVDLTPGQYMALLCLLYNIGFGSFLNSRAFQLLNQGKYAGCAYECFDPVVGFVKSHGIIVKGLQNRRALEESIWNGD